MLCDTATDGMLCDNATDGMLCDTATDNNAKAAFLAVGVGETCSGRTNKLLTRHNLTLSYTSFTWSHYRHELPNFAKLS